MAVNNGVIVIVGCGPGSPEYLVPAGRAAIEQSEVLAGAPHLLKTFAPEGAALISLRGDIDAMLNEMSMHVAHKKIAVLVSGDPGVSSLATRILERFGRSNCRIIPGISSVQTACARIGLDWQDACIVTAHGRTPSMDVSSFRGRPKIAVLAGGEASRRWLCALGVALGPEYRAYVCSDLTLPDERIHCVSVPALQTVALPSKSVVLFVEKELLS